MSSYCEVAENLVLATSTCPATDVIMVRGDVANAVSSILAAPQPQGVVVSSGVVTSSATVDAYALLLNTADAESVVSATAVLTGLLHNSARGASFTVQGMFQLIEATANATDTIPVADAPQLLVSAAQALSNIVGASTFADVFASSSSEARSFASLDALEIVTSSADAAGLIAMLQRQVDALTTDTAAVTAFADPSNTPQVYMLMSVACGVSSMQARTDALLFVGSSAEVLSDVWFKDPTSKALVMNTETTAVGWYDNFSFESIVSWKGRELAVGSDGIYELTGDSDDGQAIEAFVESGFTDFGVAQTKRLDNVYFGYTSDGQLAVKTEVYESGAPPTTYLLEARDAGAPRNSRAVPGKGLWGRYWRLTIVNVNGAAFEVHDATVDLAVSTRRV